MTWAAFIEGATDDFLSEISDAKRARALMMAVNTTARDGRAMLARDVRDQVKLPARAVSPTGRRLFVAQKATTARPEAVIRASGRPTSLAQYSSGGAAQNRSGAMVEVKPGMARYMRKAFYLKLPSGRGVDTKGNLMLAVRLRPGEALRNKMSARRVASGLYVLYGPSVDQIFESADGSGLVEDREPFLSDMLEKHFTRLLGI